MAYGQGASMARAIYALYMKKVFSDKSLPYSQDSTFKFPENFNPCYKEFNYDYTPEVAEESIEGVFD